MHADWISVSSTVAFQDSLVSVERSDPWQGCVQFGYLLCPPTREFHNVRLVSYITLISNAVQDIRKAI